jgi:hypothetical protein
MDPSAKKPQWLPFALGVQLDKAVNTDAQHRHKLPAKEVAVLSMANRIC